MIKLISKLLLYLFLGCSIFMTGLLILMLLIAVYLGAEWLWVNWIQF
jgi:hypothetical protein